jgi:lysozyme
MTTYTVLGIDCSKWQDDNSTPQQMDFFKARAEGASFVFIKASQSTWLDSDFIYNWQAAKDAGLMRGAYHFLDWTRSASEQARFFCGLLKADAGELPPVVDYECRLNAPNKLLASRALLTMLETVEKATGRAPILYTSPGYWLEFGTAAMDWVRHPLWIANYGVQKPTVPRPWLYWTFWQYTDKGDGKKFGAESAGLDMNWYNGSIEELEDFAHGRMTVAVPDRTWQAALDEWARGRGYDGPTIG